MSGRVLGADTEQMIAQSYAPETDRDDIDMSEIINAHLDYMKGEQHRSDRTIDDRRLVLLKADRDLPNGLDDVYTSDLETFLFNPNWARWTARTRHTHIVGFYRWAYRFGWMTGDPTVNMKVPPCGLARPKPIMNADEIRLALTLSPEPWYSCIMLGLGAGLRATEMSLIRREDITPEFVHVLRGKGGKERFIDTCESLWEWASARPNGLLVRRPDGGPVTGGWLSRTQHTHWRGIGLPEWHLHRLRHTFCTTMWRTREDPLVIRDLMGHSSIATTQVYALADRTEYRKAVQSVDGLLRLCDTPVTYDAVGSEHQPAVTRLVPTAA